MAMARNVVILASLLHVCIGLRCPVPRRPHAALRPAGAPSARPLSAGRGRGVLTLATRGDDNADLRLGSISRDSKVLERVGEAIDYAGGGAFDAARVAQLAGVDLKSAERGLVLLSTELAGADGCSMEVTSAGAINYVFPRNVERLRRKRSRRARWSLFWRSAKGPLATTGKWAFGVGLVMNISTLATMVVVLSTIASSAGDSDRNSNNSAAASAEVFARMAMSYTNGIWDFYRWKDFFSYDPYRHDQEPGLMPTVFSYVFGDGDVNRDLAERQLAAAAELLQQKNGVVCAEDMAGIFGAVGPGDDDGAGNVSEQWMLPVLAALGGRPEVTGDGDIVYVFDAFVNSLEGYAPLGFAEDDEPVVVEEYEQPFSMAPRDKLVVAGSLGALDLALALVAGNMLGSLSPGALVLCDAARPSQSVSVLQGLLKAYPFLLGYALLFNGIPAARYLSNRRKNRAIEKRNEKRRFWRLRRGPTQLEQRKRTAAKALAGELAASASGGDEVVYTTAESLLDQQGAMGGDSLDDFDERLRRGD